MVKVPALPPRQPGVPTVVVRSLLVKGPRVLPDEHQGRVFFGKGETTLSGQSGKTQARTLLGLFSRPNHISREIYFYGESEKPSHTAS